MIVVSAKAGVDDKVALLLGGAQDYITKPFSTKELLARVEVQLRKTGTAPQSGADEIVLNPLSHCAEVQGKPVSLTRTEYAILKLLLQNPGQVIAKSVILDRISEDTPDCTENSLKTHISHV